VLETLRYADEVNKAQGYFRDIPDDTPDPDLLDLATTLIDKKSAKFDPAKFHDRYVDALRDLIEKKRKSHSNRKIIEDKDEGGGRSGSNVVDLMAALKRSLDKPAAKAAPAKKPAPATKPAAVKKTPPAKKPPARKRA
jgi:DNA end-binding protein Ku